MIHIIAVITTKPGLRGAVLEAFRANRPNVLKMEGCIEFDAAVDAEGARSSQTKVGADTFVVIEKWASHKCHHAHLDADYSKIYREKIKDSVASSFAYVLSPADADSAVRSCGHGSCSECECGSGDR